MQNRKEKRLESSKQDSMRVGVCIVTCPRCGKLYNDHDLHVWQDSVPLSMLLTEIENLKRRVEELERLLKKNNIHFQEITTWPCSGIFENYIIGENYDNL